MSLQESTIESPHTLTSALINSNPDFEDLHQELLDNIDELKKVVFKLEGFRAQLGTNEDTKIFRAHMKNNIAIGNGTIMKIMRLQQQLDTQTLSNKEEHDYRSKLLKRNQVNFEFYRERYTNELREIYKKEMSTKPKSLKSTSTIDKISSQFNENIPEQEVMMFLKDLSCYKPILKSDNDENWNQSKETFLHKNDEQETEYSEKHKESNIFEGSKNEKYKASKKTKTKTIVIVLGTLFLVLVVALLVFFLRKYPLERH